MNDFTGLIDWAYGAWGAGGLLIFAYALWKIYRAAMKVVNNFETQIKILEGIVAINVIDIKNQKEKNKEIFQVITKTTDSAEKRIKEFLEGLSDGTNKRIDDMNGRLNRMK